MAYMWKPQVAIEFDFTYYVNKIIIYYAVNKLSTLTIYKSSHFILQEDNSYINIPRFAQLTNKPLIRVRGAK